MFWLRANEVPATAATTTAAMTATATAAATGTAAMTTVAFSENKIRPNTITSFDLFAAMNELVKLLPTNID